MYHATSPVKVVQMILILVFNSCFLAQSLVGHGLNRKNESQVFGVLSEAEALRGLGGGSRGAARSRMTSVLLLWLMRRSMTR